MTALIVPTNLDAAVTIPSGADMPATVTNGVRRSVEYIGRAEWQRQVRDAERNLAALDAYVKAHPEAEKGADAPRAMYEQIRDHASDALAQQNAPATPAPEVPPARPGVNQSDTNTTTNHAAGEE